MSSSRVHPRCVPSQPFGSLFKLVCWFYRFVNILDLNSWMLLVFCDDISHLPFEIHLIFSTLELWAVSIISKMTVWGLKCPIHGFDNHILCFETKTKSTLNSMLNILLIQMSLLSKSQKYWSNQIFVESLNCDYDT